MLYGNGKKIYEKNGHKSSEPCWYIFADEKKRESDNVIKEIWGKMLADGKR